MSIAQPFLSGKSSVSDAGLSDAEHMLRAIIDTVREPLLVLDSEFRVTQANRSFFSTFNVTPENTIGQVLFALGDGQWNIEPLRAMLEDHTSATTQLEHLDVDRVFPGIGRKIMLLNARLVTSGTGNPRATLLAIEDVTELRATEERVAAQRTELTRSNAALTEFALIASHDLQEPLRKIVSFGERLDATAGPLLSGDPKMFLDRMLNAAARMRTLITDLLVYSQATTRVRSFTSTDLGIVAREVVADLETTVAEAKGRIDVGPLPVVEADGVQMRQLMQNLLGNAIKYRRPDVPPVVKINSTGHDNGTCAFSVEDNGIGFRVEQAEKIFGMFERLHHRSQYAGSGIGLAICRRIVERHGGTIVATSTDGQGATFTVTLPVTQVAAGHIS